MIVSKWLEDPNNKELKLELESELKEDPEALASFKQMQIDFNETTTNQIPENPFFFSKLKYRMEKKREGNAYVHIHRGNLGDDDLTGGKSDLDNTVHRWLNPVARITVTVN